MDNKVRQALAPDHGSQAAYAGRIKQTEIVEIFDENGNPYSKRGYILYIMITIAQVLALVRKRLEFNPNYPKVHHGQKAQRQRSHRSEQRRHLARRDRQRLYCHHTTVTARLGALGVPLADTRRSFMEDIYDSLPPKQQEWLISQLGPSHSVKDFVKSLIIKEFVNKNP